MDERRALRDLAPEVPETDRDAQDRARVRLISLVDEERRLAPQLLSDRRPRRIAWVGVAVAVAIAVVMVQFVAQPPPAVGALRDLATTALGQPTSDLEPGQYAYTRSVGRVVRTDGGVDAAATWSYSVRVVRQVWIANDGSGMVVERYAHPRFLTPADRAAWVAGGRPPRDLTAFKHRFEPGEMATAPFERARSDPARLAGEIQEHADRFRGGQLEGDLAMIVDHLGESPASPGLRAALLDLLTWLDVSWEGGVRDDRGRAGVGVVVHADGVAITLIFDPGDSSLLGYSAAATDGRDVRATSYTFVERGVVGSIRERPEGSGT